ncbi:MAG: hypothetical protein WC833_02825 [Bacteroidales bacterium]|jgi:hypothetical protein
MKNKGFLEIIPAAAISESCLDSAAIIINTTGDSSVVNSLSELFPQSGYKVYYVEPGINQLKETLALCSSLKIRSIVLCGEELPELKSIMPEKTYSAALVSAGSNEDKSNILAYLLEDRLVSDFSHIAYQSYKYDPKLLQKTKEKCFEDLRLGSIRGDISRIEPHLRSVNYIFLDLRSVRYSDFPESLTKSPNGLYSEEICQLGRYIGMGQNLITAFIYGYPSKSKPKSSSAQLAAEILWHMFEAISSNVIEDPAVPDVEKLLLRKIVSMGQEGQDLDFYTSSSTGRWWMKIPEVNNNNNQYVACSYSDYITACSGEIPMRWLFFFQKINHN